MIYPALITVLSLLLYTVFAFNTARARGKYKIIAPAMTGHIEFEKRLRVQLNTLEQLIVFLPAIWLFGFFWPYGGHFLGISWSGPHLAAAIGLIWLGARIVYSFGYCRSAEKRFPGFIVGLLCQIVLTVGALIGILSLLYQHYQA